MKTSTLLIKILLLLLLLLSQYTFADTYDLNSGWQIIPTKKSVITDNNGKPFKTINPGCAFNVLPDSNGKLVDNSFRFYFKQGKTDKLVVFFNGGGACWNDSTCLSSLTKGIRPTYTPSVLQENSPMSAGGIFDDNNKDNPFRDWSKVFIPYCTGDLHVGSNTATYSDDQTGSFSGIPNAPISINHRGFDNFLAVREWIKDKYSNEDKHAKDNKLKKLFVTGSSAGGYGATLNFPYLQYAFPETKAVLLSDGAAAVTSPGFLTTVFKVGGNWNLESTLSFPIFGNNILGKHSGQNPGSYSVNTFNIDIFSSLAKQYPESRFAQYSTAFDSVQTQFLKIMNSIDFNILNPDQWALTEQDSDLFGLWNFNMTSSFQAIAKTNKKYEYYIGAGNVHTILTDAFAPTPSTHPFYDEHSAENVFFSDWINRFVNRENFKAENLQAY